MGKSRYLVLQLDMAKHPRDIASRYHTGCGVLFPVSCDGYYDSEEGANQVAEFLASEYPSMRTHVVQVVK